MAIISAKKLQEFYENDSIALIGASNNKMKYGCMAFNEYKKRNLNVIPVNPRSETIGGDKAYKSVKDIPGGVKAAVVVVPPDQQQKVVLECAEAGVKTVWIHEHVMKGVSDTKAIYLCEEKGMDCITGFCPMMWMPKTGFPHNIHKGIMRIFGALPK